MKFGVFALLMGLVAGCNKVTFEQAEEAFNKKQYKQAGDMYSKVISAGKLSKEKRAIAAFKQAESYRMANKYEPARKAYEKVLKRDPKNAEALYYLAIILQKQGKYREATTAFDNYLQQVPGDTKAEKKKLGCELGIRWTEDSSRFKVSVLKAANTGQNDYAPMIGSKDDKLLFFTTDREGGINKRPYGWYGNWYSDIWVMKLEGKRDKAKWGKPEPVKDLNTVFNNGESSFDSRFNTMYLTVCNGETEKNKTRTCKIYNATKKGDGWGELAMLDFCRNDSFNYGHPALSSDGTRLYFTSDKPDGLGGYDIWMVNFIKRGKTWSEAVNLGESINTENDEMFPYWNKHEDKLYWASNGLPGLGGLDIFSAKGTATEWTEVENLRKPLNSAGDDFGITFTEKNKFRGFFTSNRGEGNKSDDNIYEFNIEPLVFTLSGVITDCSDGKTLAGATVIITNDRDTNKIIMKTDALGAYKVTLAEETSYEVQAKYSEKYYFDSKVETQTTKGLKFSKNLIQDFCLQYPNIITLPIYYDLDKAVILPDAQIILDNFLADVANKYPKLTFELGSHTDCRSSYDYNVDLSKRRADSAIAYLAAHGLDVRRIEAKGYGESQLLNDCKCEGSEAEGFTIFKPKASPTDITYTRKLVFEEIGGVRTSHYEDYKPSEIVVKNGKQYVKCDEFQHRQNRRTTVKILSDNFDGKKVKVDTSRGNSNRGSNDTAAIKGGPIGSAVLDSIKKAAEIAAGPVYDSTTAIKVKIVVDGTNKSLASTVNEKESVNWAYDLAGKFTAIPPDVAKQWMESKLITKKDFEDGDEVTFPGGFKFRSGKFKLKSVVMGELTFTDIIITISSKVDKPTLGRIAFKEYKPESFEHNGELVLIPKKVKKPVIEK